MDNMKYKDLLKKYMQKVLDITGDDHIYSESTVELTQVETDELSDIFEEVIADLSI
jgi:uncharacterized protein YciU (UPF0263 family)